MGPKLDAAAWVLAGGRSTRMGRDKALLPFRGLPLIEHALEKLEGLARLHNFASPCIAGNRLDLASFAPVVGDLHPGCGPLGGIESALTVSSASLNLFLAVDLPFVPMALLSALLVRAALTGTLVTVPRVGGRVQPLCAVYHRGLLPEVSKAIDSGEYKITRMIENGIVGEGSETCIHVFNLESLVAAYPALLEDPIWPAFRWFENCNSPTELAAMESYMKSCVQSGRRDS